MSLYIITFGIASIFMHFGVFVQDLANITNIALRLLFYASGVFYALETRVPEPYNRILIDCNPVALIINECRNVLLYRTPINYKLVGIWLILGLFISYIGIRTIYKYENTYVKVMR